MTMPAGRCRDIAHVSAVELRTQVPEMTVDFFVRLLGMSEVAREGDRVWLRTWDDYERFTVCVVGGPDLRDRPDLDARGQPGGAGPPGGRDRGGRATGWAGRTASRASGPAYLFSDPDGHDMGVYWETEWSGRAGGAAPGAEEPGLAASRAAAPTCGGWIT